MHFLDVPRVHEPVLNYTRIITICVQRLSYIHAYTKKKIKTKQNIAATGELEKQSLSLPRHNQINLDIYYFYIYFISSCG